MPTCLCICVSIFVPICVYICVSVFVSLCLCVFVSVCLFVWVLAKMSTPGVEPGLSRPRRDVLTTRRCGHSRCSWQLIKSDHFMAGSALHRLLQKKTEVFLSYRAGCTDSLAQWLTARSTKLVVGGSIPRARGFEFGERHGGGTAGRRRDRGGGMGCGGSLNGRRQEKPASW